MIFIYLQHPRCDPTAQQVWRRAEIVTPLQAAYHVKVATSKNLPGRPEPAIMWNAEDAQPRPSTFIYAFEASSQALLAVPSVLLPCTWGMAACQRVQSEHRGCHTHHISPWQWKIRGWGVRRERGRGRQRAQCQLCTPIFTPSVIRRWLVEPRVEPPPPPPLTLDPNGLPKIYPPLTAASESQRGIEIRTRH
jgi:hypothetical protein